jgi:hypothetical protein|eukprot:SAG25_NODE_111_length_14954_cov_8.187950_11_plen_98_part_00
MRNLALSACGEIDAYLVREGTCSRSSASPFYQNCSSAEICSATSDSSIARHVCMAPTGSMQHRSCHVDADCPVGASCDPLTSLCVTDSGPACSVTKD